VARIAEKAKSLKVGASDIRLAYERGVLLIAAGTFGNVIRFLTPLVITDDEIDEGLDVIGASLATLSGVADSLRRADTVPSIARPSLTTL
jgi:4-aminobutyrate aminotransferase-like enzyme